MTVIVKGLHILGTGRYLPQRVVENEEFAGFLETSHEWIVSHTGIERRHFSAGEPTWYMAAEAAKQALDAAGLAAEDIDVIIGTTVCPDYFYPAMACMVQLHLGNTRAFCYDVSAACAGSCYALDIARSYLCTGQHKHVLVASAEMLSQHADFEDRGSCILFGDGGSAVVVSAGEGMYASHMGTDSSGAKSLYYQIPRKDTPLTKWPGQSPHEPFDNPRAGRIVMDGHEIYRLATRVMASSVAGACEKAGITPADLDLIIPHQANLRIIKTAMKTLGLPMDKVYVNIQDYGNTSSATIPICLDECVRGGRLKRGDKFCMVGFGSGLVYGAIVMEY